MPWTAAYNSVPLLKGKRKFVLGASGHIAGVINPPAKGKRSFWTNDGANGKLPATAEAWMAGATEHPGSWWTTWSDWLKPNGGQAGQCTQDPPAAQSSRPSNRRPAAM